ncbi:uncharacterized protein [Physcomitrium patens]|uniref:uncharacterized protein isoform X2 n=1 Tax=Physcomitrium patens TaxID=3218 RepID=UPI000D17692F|nr:uncharacterized protein LOC112276215 isoform X2 [Physcomitrium patens]|eukprot:XP_024363100.1 uncharacterized protein LOC112276215 isoform X2 [Physcomitrella patens]
MGNDGEKKLSVQEFEKCFPEFTNEQKEKLFLIYTRVVAKLQEDVMLEFKPLCEAWELKEVLEELEELIERHELGDVLTSRSAPLTDAVRAMTTKIKQEEVDKLKLLVQQEEEHVAQLRLQREALQAKAREEPTALAATLGKVRRERVELSL